MMRKKWLLAVISLVVMGLAIALPSKIQAQTHECYFSMAMHACNQSVACPSGYEPATPCSDRPEDDCAGTYSCVDIDDGNGGGSECDDVGGSCEIIRYGVCPDAYQSTPVGGPGEMGCSGLRRCCVPLASGCQAWNPITGCPVGYIRCPDDQTVCCADADDCPIYTPPTPRPPGNGNGGGPDPGAGCEGCAGICTAIGCIDVQTPTDFINSVGTIALGIAGGIAFLMIVFGAFQVLTSAGNPEKIKAGSQMIASAIGGLLLIIFAVFILRVVGVDIFGLPEFGT